MWPFDTAQWIFHVPSGCWRSRCMYVPVCAIGGITHDNIAHVVAAGADLASVISAVVAADDPRAAAARLAAAFRQ